MRYLTPLLVMACTTTPSSKWTHTHAYRGLHTTLDHDQDGRVDAAEYAHRASAAPPFSSVDADQNGELSIEELAALVSAQDPLIFDARPEPKAINLEQWRSSFSGDSAARLQQEFDALMAEP